MLKVYQNLVHETYKLIEIYNKEYLFVVNLTIITKLSSKPLKLLWYGLAPTWTSNSHFRYPT